MGTDRVYATGDYRDSIHHKELRFTIIFIYQSGVSSFEVTAGELELLSIGKNFSPQ